MSAARTDVGLSYLVGTADSRLADGTGLRLPNGARVLLGHVGAVVLAHWRGEFVTWTTDTDGSAYWGHYHNELLPAVADFAGRAVTR